MNQTRVEAFSAAELAKKPLQSTSTDKVYQVSLEKRKVQVFFRSIRLLTVSIVSLSVMTSFAFGNSKIKKPNVSGQFYSSDAKELSADIDNFISLATVEPSQKKIEVLMAPHAGYMYSGGVAAYAFKSASTRNYKTIVILAPSHYVGFDGISVWEEGGFKTPLGTVEVDKGFAKKLIASNEKVYFEPRAFEREHSLEVEIPFLQKSFKDYKIVPVIFGQPSLELLEDFARTLKNIIADRNDVLIVVSTDLSHYHDDATARAMDAQAIEAIEKLDVQKVWKETKANTMEMCGAVPVSAAMLYAKAKGLTEVDVLRYANSGDVSQDKDRVVGYTAIAIYGDGDRSQDIEKNKGADVISSLTLTQKKRLIEIARTTVEKYVRHGTELEVQESDPRLMEVEGAFVTLHKKSDLRGCIGNIIGRQPLYLTVRDMAISAAVKDPRFPPVTVEELSTLDVEVSVLSKPRVITDVAEIEMGVHGVIVSQGRWHSGVFLPQVATDTGWSKEEFLSQLCSQKAHLSPDAWKDPKTKIEIFSAEVFSEKDLP